MEIPQMLVYIYMVWTTGLTNPASSSKSCVELLRNCNERNFFFNQIYLCVLLSQGFMNYPCLLYGFALGKITHLSILIFMQLFDFFPLKFDEVFISDKNLIRKICPGMSKIKIQKPQSQKKQYYSVRVKVRVLVMLQIVPISLTCI